MKTTKWVGMLNLLDVVGNLVLQSFSKMCITTFSTTWSKINIPTIFTRYSKVLTSSQLTEVQELGSDFPKNPYWLWTEEKNFWKSVRTWSETVQIDWICNVEMK